METAGGAAGYDGANQLQHVVDARKSVPAMKDLLALEQVASVVHLDVLAHIAGQYENAATLKPAVAYQPPPRPTLGYVTTGKVEKRYRKMKNGKQGRVCSNPRCNSFVTKYGLCKRHGGRDKCTMAGCNTNAEARGLCRKHGATGFCSSPGCSSYVHARHMCRKHSDTGVCSVKECKNFAQVQGLCRKHSGQATCATSGCNSLSGLSSLSEASAMCRKHVSPRTNETCTAAGCTHSVQARSLCKTHLLTGDALLDAASTLQAVDSIPMMLSAAAAADEVLRLD